MFLPGSVTFLYSLVSYRIKGGIDPGSIQGSTEIFKGLSVLLNPSFLLVAGGGFEPPTFGL